MKQKKTAALVLALLLVLCLLPVSASAGTDARLKGIKVQNATLSSKFSAAQTEYTITVPQSNIYVPVTLTLNLEKSTDEVRAIRTNKDDQVQSNDLVKDNKVLFPCDPYTISTLTLTVTRTDAESTTYTFVCDRRLPEQSNVYASIDEKEASDAMKPTNVTEYYTGVPYVVVCRTLNVRSTAGTEKAPVGKLTRGTVVTVIEADGEWVKIGYNGTTAYVYSKYLDH